MSLFLECNGNCSGAPHGVYAFLFVHLSLLEQHKRALQYEMNRYAQTPNLRNS